MPVIEDGEPIHDALLWPRVGTGTDDYGDPVVATVPIPLRVRWMYDESEAVAPDGSTVAINARAAVDRLILIDSRMWKGTLEDWNANPAAHMNEVMRVATYQEADDVLGYETAREVGLKWWNAPKPS